MSTYYDFMVEAKYEGKWYNIDFHTKDIDVLTANCGINISPPFHAVLLDCWRIG